MPAQAEAPSLPPPDTPAVQKILFDKSLWQCYVKPAAINVNIINCIFIFFIYFLSTSAATNSQVFGNIVLVINLIAKILCAHKGTTKYSDLFSHFAYASFPSFLQAFALLHRVICSRQNVCAKLWEHFFRFIFIFWF